MDALRQVGLVLNAGKTNILTTQSQHPAEFVSPGGIVVEILERDRAHKWLGCMTSTHTGGSHGLDLEHHPQAASRAVYANKSILSDKSVSIAERLAYFDAMVTPVACFASGHRKIYKQDLRKLDVKFRKLVRTMHHCGPPWRPRLVRSRAPHPSRVEGARFGMCSTSWCQIMVPEMPGTTLEITKLHCQPFR